MNINIEIQTQKIMPHTHTGITNGQNENNFAAQQKFGALVCCWAFVNGIDQTTDLEIKLGAHLAFFVRIHAVCYSVTCDFSIHSRHFPVRPCSIISTQIQRYSFFDLFILFSFGGGEIDLKSSFSSAVKILASHLRLPNAVNAVHFR